MTAQLREETPTHQAASLLDEAISRLKDALASTESGPMVEKLEQNLTSIRNELERLERAIDTEDIQSILKELERLCEKVAHATRNYKSLFTV
jgi:hypothetical protein